MERQVFTGVMSALIAVLTSAGCNSTDAKSPTPATTKVGGSAQEEWVVDAAVAMLREGRQTFRYDTFGDEAFWGGQLRLHEAIAGENNGGSGPGVSPKNALSVGLKVDVEALPESLVAQLKAGEVNLDDPATTVALLRLNAVVGLTGLFSENVDDKEGRLTSIGIQCALCHSTVDDSFAPGIGQRLDGWANRDLDVGTIITLAPNLDPFTDLLGVDRSTLVKALKAWGPGKFDAELSLDGKAFRPDGKTAATLIPPAFGLLGVNLTTWTGWGSLTYWNAFVANLEMHGQGNFFDPRLDDEVKFPVAAKNKMGHKADQEDKITAKLPALHYYQLSIKAPEPRAGTFDTAAAKRGDSLFGGKARCATCHTTRLFTEPGWNLHKGADIGIDEFQALRSPDERYRSAPLRGLWTHAKGGFYHDGRFATLDAVVEHYDTFFKLGLSAGEKADVVEYLKSL